MLFTVSEEYGLSISCRKDKTSAMHIQFRPYPSVGREVDDDEEEEQNDERAGERRPPLLVETLKGLEQIGWTTSHRMLGPQIESNHALGTDFDITGRIRAAKKAFFKHKLFYFSDMLTLKTKGLMLRTFVLPVLLYGSHSWVLDSRRKTRLRTAWRWLCRMASKKPNRYRLKMHSKYHHWQLQQRLGVQSIEVYRARRLMRFIGHTARRSEHVPAWRLLFGRQRTTRRSTSARGSKCDTWDDTATDDLRCVEHVRINGSARSGQASMALDSDG